MSVSRSLKAGPCIYHSIRHALRILASLRSQAAIDGQMHDAKV
jgi:hypothetical protein